MPDDRQVGAFAPGRLNLIGEHTDYNAGVALPFALKAGTTVRARANGRRRMQVHALDLDEQDEFDLVRPDAAEGWRAFARGAVAELRSAGYPLVGAELHISGDLPRGAGLSSSASLEIALCLALLELIGAPLPSPLALARLCARVERKWVGAQTGLLDQLASLCGAPGQALLIDFESFELTPVPLHLENGWRLVTLDSGERHSNAGSAYNQRRAECAEACELLGVDSLRRASQRMLGALPESLRRRAAHVVSENRRVFEAQRALEERDLSALGSLLNASHASLRDDYEVSTEAVEATVRHLLNAGAAGARIVGGGFGGHVLALLGPDVALPEGARIAHAGGGARLL